MLNKQEIQEFATIKERISEVEKKLSDFSDMLHGQSTKSIDTTDGGVVELADLVADLLDRVEALEERN